MIMSLNLWGWVVLSAKNCTAVIQARVLDLWYLHFWEIVGFVSFAKTMDFKLDFVCCRIYWAQSCKHAYPELQLNLSEYLKNGSSPQASLPTSVLDLTNTLVTKWAQIPKPTWSNLVASLPRRVEVVIIYQRTINMQISMWWNDVHKL